MANDSSTGGILQPLPDTPPLEGQALLDFIQQYFSAVGGMAGNLMLQRWQPEPPNIPAGANCWASLGIAGRTADTYPAVVHNPDGSDTMQRHEIMDILVSFYDLGSGAAADGFAALLRDGLLVAQNNEVLFLASMGLVAVGDLIAVPSLVKERWLYRVDLSVQIRRLIERTYGVLNIESLVGELETDTGLSRILTTTPPA